MAKDMRVEGKDGMLYEVTLEVRSALPCYECMFSHRHLIAVYCLSLVQAFKNMMLVMKVNEIFNSVSVSSNFYSLYFFCVDSLIIYRRGKVRISYPSHGQLLIHFALELRLKFGKYWENQMKEMKLQLKRKVEYENVNIVF